MMLIITWIITYIFFSTLSQVYGEDYKKIVNGVEVTKGRYPYQVALFTEDDQFYCGGTLVSPSHVLTAAHCVLSCTAYVEIGRHNFLDDSEKVEKIEVESMIKHPSYDCDSVDFDFGILKLRENSTYDTVTLDDGTHDLIGGENVTIIGWGSTKKVGAFEFWSFSSSLSDVLLEAEVDVVSNNDCKDAYGDSGITDQMFCAAREGTDTCQGDSGGPALILGLNSTEDIQMGITSWGFGCADKNYPGVYARVSTVKVWIEQVLNGTYALSGDERRSYKFRLFHAISNGIDHLVN